MPRTHTYTTCPFVQFSSVPEVSLSPYIVSPVASTITVDIGGRSDQLPYAEQRVQQIITLMTSASVKATK